MGFFDIISDIKKKINSLSFFEKKDKVIQNDSVVDVYNFKDHLGLKNYLKKRLTDAEYKKVSKLIDWYGYLETCGISSCITLINSLLPGQLKEIDVNGQKFRPKDILFIFMNNPENYRLFQRARPNMNLDYFVLNRIPQMYPVAVKLLWDIDAEFKWNDKFDNIVKELEKRNKIQLQLLNPGHYIACVDYDQEKKSLVCHDPNTKNKDKYKYIDEKEFDKNVAKWFIVYYKKEIPDIKLFG